ncbi:hypothetical protein PR202_gb17052 [Eleusine coracana subsp. coracana]|uniref:Reverse transcriptase zinc-binding domain-containing protein n=1 Tax=Eleusine coracana subsp. coracana TaxID=191504 RepID=A0AAV5F1R1_ELECO|nr:hypothetical protein PR202_gb17052 [Eleusine coracana subsp. coracana]
MMDRLNTRNLLRRKNLKIQNNDYSYVTCRQCVEETAMHLFFKCSFSTSCWDWLGIHWQVHLNFFDMILEAKHQFQHQFFFEIIIIACWHIWKQRNDKIFERKVPFIDDWRRKFKDECRLQSCRFKDQEKDQFLLWLDSLYLGL